MKPDGDSGGRELTAILDRALSWARSRGWAGIDPYDALSSPAIAGMGSLLGRPFEIAATQAVRRSPLNLRSLLGIRPAFNPKAGALFLTAAALTDRAADVADLSRRIAAVRNRDYPFQCWGYPFPWRSRAFYFPAGTPTVVVTSFVGEAMLVAHQRDADPEKLAAALGACEFVVDGLNRTSDATGVCLSYSPLDRSAVYNASLLGARLLTVVGKETQRPALIQSAVPLIDYVLARQRSDGSWSYGEAGHHGWVDSFHTGFVLGALHVYATATGDGRAADAVERGARYYAATFFGPNGEPYYFAHRQHPYDVHSAAQGVITLLELSDRFPELRDRARTVTAWMIANLLDSAGFFYYQIRKTHRVRIPYMRWSQAWATRALAEAVARGL